MASQNAMRFINRKRNKVQYFSAHLAKDPRWLKMTGYEPQPLVTDPVESKPVPEFHLSDLGSSLPTAEKPKRKYTKKAKKD